MYTSQDLAIRIKAIAKERNTVIKDMLAELSLGSNTMSALYHGKSIAFDSLAKIADYLNCSVDYLLGRTDNPSATGGTYIKNNNHNVNQAINGDVNINADTSEKDDKQLFDMIKGLDLVQRSETIVYINNLKKKEGE